MGSIIACYGRWPILFRPGEWTFFTKSFALDLDLTQVKNVHFLEPRERMSDILSLGSRKWTFLPWVRSELGGVRRATIAAPGWGDQLFLSTCATLSDIVAWDWVVQHTCPHIPLPGIGDDWVITRSFLREEHLCFAWKFPIKKRAGYDPAIPYT